MLKEIKYLIFILVISVFIFFTGRYYFSDENLKNSYRSYKNNDEKIKPKDLLVKIKKFQMKS